jgi:hypothetical protein
MQSFFYPRLFLISLVILFSLLGLLIKNYITDGPSEADLVTPIYFITLSIWLITNVILLIRANYRDDNSEMRESIGMRVKALAVVLILAQTPLNYLGTVGSIIFLSFTLFILFHIAIELKHGFSQIRANWKKHLTFGEHNINLVVQSLRSPFYTCLISLIFVKSAFLQVFGEEVIRHHYEKPLYYKQIEVMVSNIDCQGPQPHIATFRCSRDFIVSEESMAFDNSGYYSSEIWHDHEIGRYMEIMSITDLKGSTTREVTGTYYINDENLSRCIDKHGNALCIQVINPWEVLQLNR